MDDEQLGGLERGPTGQVQELEQLERLHRNGALTDAEFASAKANVLGTAGPPPPPPIAPNVAPVHTPPRTRPIFKVLGVVVLIWVGVMLVLATGNSSDGSATDDEREDLTAPPAAAGPAPVEHTVQGTRDVSTGVATRYVTEVQVAPGTTRAQLVALAEWLVTSRRAAGDYDALAMRFYDIADTDGIPSLGMAEDAPYGDWGRADEAIDGYATHRLDTSKLREMDWTKRPTDAQRKAHDLNARLERRLSDGDTSVGDLDWRIAEIARETGQTPGQVRAGIDAVMAWELGFDDVTLD